MIASQYLSWMVSLSFNEGNLNLIHIVIFLLISITIYCTVIFYLLLRRQYQPLKSKGANLLIISTLGNAFFSTTLYINKMIANVYNVGSFFEPGDPEKRIPPNQAVVEFSCALSHIQYGIFMPLFFFPYYMRAYRLYLVYKAHLTHFELKKQHGVMAFKSIKSLHFVREKNMIKWLVAIMIPLFIMTIVAILDNDFRSYFPSFEAKSCLLGSNYFTQAGDINKKFQLHLYYTIESYLITNFALNALLMWLIYLLRDIQAEFSMNYELKVLTFTQICVDFVIFFFLIIAPTA